MKIIGFLTLALSLRERTVDMEKTRAELGSKELLDVSKVLHKVGHKTYPFMIVETVNGKSAVVMSFASTSDAHDMYSALVKFFTSNAANEPCSEAE